METPVTNENVISLLQDLGMDTAYNTHSLALLAQTNSRYLKDIRLNVSTTLSSSNLTRKEAYLLALSVAVNERHDVLVIAFENLAKKENATIEEIAETHGCASLLSLNNMFYRFRHFTHDVAYYSKQSTGLRMSLVMNPVMGKGFFELMSLVVSALNGCELCVVAHERTVKEHGASEQRVYDAIRLGSVIKGLCVIL